MHGNTAETEQLRREVEQRDARIDALRDVVASLEGKNAALQSALINHASEIELLKRKLFGPRSERTGTSELQLTFDELQLDDKALQSELAALTAPDSASDDGDADAGAPPSDSGFALQAAIRST